jgi:hypothetical protein
MRHCCGPDPKRGAAEQGGQEQDAAIAIPKVGGMNDRSAWAAKLGCVPKNQIWLYHRPGSPDSTGEINWAQRSTSQDRRIHAGFEEVIQYCRLQRTLGWFHCLSADRQAWPRFRAPTLSGIGVSLSPSPLLDGPRGAGRNWFHLNTTDVSRPDQPDSRKPRSNGRRRTGLSKIIRSAARSMGCPWGQV